MTGSAINLPIEEAAERYSKAEAEVKAKVEAEAAPQRIRQKAEGRRDKFRTPDLIAN